MASDGPGTGRRTAPDGTRASADDPAGRASGSAAALTSTPSPVPADLRPLAERLFGDRLALAERFTGLLMAHGVERGLIGPREVDRLWERHVLNCALLVDALPAQARTLADVGSGAGLPGLVIAIARPDLRVTLIETMQRRVTWLEEASAALGLQVEVVRARAEELHGQRSFDVVTARAVAALDKLARWTLPLVADHGHLLAMKGSSAGTEIEAAEKTLRRLGGLDPQVHVVGEGEVELPTTVVTVRRAERPEAPAAGARRSGQDGQGKPAARKNASRTTTSRGARHGRTR